MQKQVFKHCSLIKTNWDFGLLQFEKSSSIHSIDIGNEGSAFVEVLVGRSSLAEDNYEV